MPEGSTKNRSSKSSVNKTTLIVIIVITVLIILGGGYLLQQQFTERLAEKAIEDTTGGKVNISEGGNKITIETDDGKPTVGQNQIPKNFPPDVSIYPGSEVVTSSESNDNFTLALTTSNSVSKVRDFYRNDLEKNGWDTSEAPVLDKSFIISGTKGNRKVDIVVSLDNNGKTGVAIVIIKL